MQSSIDPERVSAEMGFSNFKLPVYAWRAFNKSQNQPQAIILALHGGCLNGRSFEHLGGKLAKQDLVLVSLDLRGYGKWRTEDFGSKKDRTFDYDKSRKDVALVLAHIHSIYPDIPVFCMGESLGASMSTVIA
ncbi:MAG: lysophospholipase, partial [Candidatus Obscuribacterales bacterium]|nr:lysophospholipase [Candidatus Obscuribacterales bacterium]